MEATLMDRYLRNGIMYPIVIRESVFVFHQSLMLVQGRWQAQWRPWSLQPCAPPQPHALKESTILLGRRVKATAALLLYSTFDTSQLRILSEIVATTAEPSPP